MPVNKQTDYKLLPVLASKSEPEWKRFLSKNRKKLEGMDLQIHALHDKISERTDCLQCANCCRSLGPRITDKDVERMAKALRLKAADVITRYLRIDEDGDTVFQSMPCPFWEWIIIAVFTKIALKPAGNIHIPTENASIRFIICRLKMHIPAQLCMMCYNN